MAETSKSPENTERLFLLELLVDSVEIDYPKLQLDCNLLKSLKQTCVRFQFLNYPALDVCEEDFCSIPEDYRRDKIVFQSGKSCLFSLRGLPTEIRGLDVCVYVSRQRDSGAPFELAKTKISLGSSFTNILTQESPENLSRTSKDTHPLFDEKGETVGRITVYVSLSCFGKMIITQFQISGDENRSFLFKGVADKKEVEESTVSNPYICEGGSPAGDASREWVPGRDCVPSAPQQSASLLAGPQEPAPSQTGIWNQPFPDGMVGPPPQYPYGMAGYMPSYPPPFPTQTPGLPTPTPDPGAGASNETEECQDFKEIGVEINGHSLSIKVPKRKKKKKVEEKPAIPFCGKVAGTSESSSESEVTDNNPQPSGTAPDINFCSCDVALPPGFGASPPPPKPKKKKKPKCPLAGTYCLKPDCPMGYPTVGGPEPRPEPPRFVTPPGAVGVKGDQIVFQMPATNQTGFPTNPNARYTFGGIPESNLQKVQMMTDEQAAAPCGVNPSSDVFLLKVGKKNPDTGKRSTMEVEVKSPRKVEKKLVDVQTQYEAQGAEPAAKPAPKGGKGKGGKGKKK